MPARDDARHLPRAVEAVIDQAWPGAFEVLLVVGPSRDDTASVAHQLAAQHRSVRVVDNPWGVTPDALNVGIAAASHDVVVRVDAHGELPTGYLSTAVATLQRTGAANVGGVMVAQGRSLFEQAVAASYNSRLGLGGGGFHLTDTPEGPAPTVFLGCFRKDALLAAGGYHPDLVRAQDWELNHRLRAAGEVVWFTPELQVTYRPRSSLGALARQFFRTGQWRREIVRRLPETASPRYLAPPVLVGATSSGVLVALLGRAVGRGRVRGVVRLGWLPLVAYLTAIAVGSATLPKPLPLAVRVRLPAVLAVMHLAWGLGFVRGVPEQQRHRADHAPRPTKPAR